jgi:PAS domain-containing protein
MSIEREVPWRRFALYYYVKGIRMKRLCAWCGKDLGGGKASAEDSSPVSHGICDECAAVHFQPYKTHDLRAFLDDVGEPIMVVDASGTVVTANRQALRLLGKRAEEIDGRLGGEVINCIYADLPGGCGATEHCVGCAIRNTVTETCRTGRGRRRVETYSIIKSPEGQARVRFLISTEKVSSLVLLRIEEMERDRP